MKLRLKLRKCLSVLTLLAVVSTNIGFADIENLGQIDNKIENVNLAELNSETTTPQAITLKLSSSSNFKVRIEGNNKTIVEPTNVEVSDLDLNKYGIEKKFEEPKPVHAILKALESVNIDTLDKNEGIDVGEGSYITMIDGLKAGSTSANDGWMYYVDNSYADSGIDTYDINNNQSIVVFFQEDYNKNIYSWFENEELSTKTAEKVTVKLMGNRYDYSKNKTITEPVENAVILVNDTPYIQNGKYINTDKNGQATLLFDKAGSYHISAEKKDSTQTRIISRPYCKIKVEQGENPVIDKSKLEKLIKESEALLLKAKEGTLVGQYPIGSKSKLETLVNSAKKLLENQVLSQLDIDTQISNLEIAILEFKNSVNKDESLDEIINALKEYYNGKNSYDFITSLGLRKAGMDTDVLLSKVNIYGMEGLHNNSRNVINIIAVGQNPHSYKDKDYTDFLKNYDYSKEKNSQYIAKAIIAMDMSNTDYDKEKIISRLISQAKSQGSGKIAFGSQSEGYYDDLNDEMVDGEFTPSIEDSVWALIALSSHKDFAGADSVIEGVKKYIKSEQGSDGLIKNSSETALVIQALIALGENPRDSYWNEADKSLIDGILSCRKNNQFMLNPKSGMASDIATSFVLAALADMSDMRSMYTETKNEEIGKPIRINITKIPELYVGAKANLEVKAYDKNNQVVKNAALNIEALDKEIIKIENGKVYALKAGKGKIKASVIGNSNIFGEIEVSVVIPPEVDKSKEIQAEIDFLKEHYEAYNSFEFLAAPASVLSGMDKEKVGAKIYPYSNTIALQNAKTIISLVGADLDPRDAMFKNKKTNFVEKMQNAQIKEGADKGKFVINKSGDPKSVLSQAYCIIAMDITNADYDEESAVKALLDMLNNPDYKKDSSYTNIETEAVVATALSKHKDISEVSKTIDELIEFLRLSQNADAGFDMSSGSTFVNSPIAIGAVIQALYSNDIDPFSWKWRKGEKTIIDALVKSKFIGSDASKSGYAQGEGLGFENTKSSHYAFAAVISMKHKKSIYDLIQQKAPIKQIEANIIVDGISKNILETQTLKIEENSFALDILRKSLDQSKIKYEVTESSYGPYVLSIDDEKAGSLGGYDGWMYEVNGKSPEVGAGAYILKHGDKVKFFYSRWPKLNTSSKIASGQKNPIVKVNLSGDTFKEDATVANNWTIASNDVGLKLKSISKIDNQNMEFIFEGISKDGKLSIIPKKEILVSEKDANSIFWEISSYKKQLDDTLIYLSDKLKNPSLGSEWSILALSRGGYVLDSKFIDSYIENIEQKSSSMSKATDYERVAIVVTALGKNAEKIGKINLFEKLSDFNYLDRQGINASIFGLIALNTKSYDIPAVEGTISQNSKAKMLKYILDNELKSGGWALSGDVADTDTTAMAIQALAPYYKQGDSKVKSAVDRALNILSELQTNDGDYLSRENSNPESTVQVLVALCELDKDPLDSKNGFVKDGKTLIDGILKYKIAGGGFKHSFSETSPNGVATEQCAYGLVAYDRFVNGRTSLYDMSDIDFKTKKIEKLELKDGKVEIPLDNNKDFDVELKSDQKAQIVIPENTESKVLLKTESKKSLAEISVKKGKHGLKIPQGVKIEEGHAEIELFVMKSEAQKSQIKGELSDKVKKLDSKVKDVKVEDAFKIGNADKIEFSDYVELVFTNMVGKGAAYVDDTGIHIIERVADEKAGIGKIEYAFDRGNDLVVKTKHFTDFITYSLEKDAGNTGGGTDGSGGTGGSGGGIPSKDLTVTLSIDKKTINKGYVIDPTVVKINKGDTVWDVVKKEMESRGIDYRYNNSNQYGSVYVESIAGDGEFDHGRWSGWMYNVNGKYPNYGCSKYILNGGENVEWRYTTNLGEDLGQDNSAWGKPGESTKTETIEKGSTVLKSEAKVDKKEAKAEIDSKFIKGIVSEAVEKKLTQIVIEPTVEDKKAEFNKVSVVLEKESIEKIAKEAKASLKLKTKFGDVKLFTNTLENLFKEKGNTVTISVKQNEDNTVTVEVKAGLDNLDKVSGGMIVSLPVSEASASNIMVQVMPDKTEQILMKSVAADRMLSAKLDGSAKVKIVQRKVDFADTSVHWAKENIEFVSARDIIKGTKSNEFSPNSRVNRAMLTTILHRFENEMQVEGQNYSDVTKDSYYANAALWAKTKGIVSDTDKFEAKEELTREQIAEMIYNYAKASGENVSNISKANVQKFEDFSTLDSASQDAVAYCYEKGVIGGKSETKLDPKGKTTRAEVSAIIQRYIVNSVK